MAASSEARIAPLGAEGGPKIESVERTGRDFSRPEFCNLDSYF